MVEHTLLADSNVRIGQTVAAYAPIRPAGPAPPFVSSFAVTAQLAPVGIPVPGIDGMLLLDLSTLFTDPFGLSMHNNFTGLAERSFGNYPLLWPQMTFPMQMVTLDVSNGRLIFSNVADFTM
jgi:hypothetical protein